MFSDSGTPYTMILFDQFPNCSEEEVEEEIKTAGYIPADTTDRRELFEYFKKCTDAPYLCMLRPIKPKKFIRKVVAIPQTPFILSQR